MSCRCVLTTDLMSLGLPPPPCRPVHHGTSAPNESNTLGRPRRAAPGAATSVLNDWF